MLDGADELELGNLFDEIDMVEALDPVEITLVDRIDVQVAGPAIGGRLAPLADVDFYRAGLVLGSPTAMIGLRLAQVVEVAVGDAGEALLVAVIAEERVCALTELAGSGA